MKHEKPWGYFETLSLNRKCTVKIITIVPGGRLSLQRHHKRDEVWYALDPGLTFEVRGVSTRASVGQKFTIPRGVLHRASAERKARILEISLGQFSEDDIERIEDDYARVKKKKG